MTNLMHWRLLVAIAESGGISKAATNFGMTQSGASQAIARLEDLLGVPLLVRDRKHTVPTAIGEQVIARARKMLAELDAIQALADEAKGLQRGRITLASFPSVFVALLPPLLRTFRRLHPGIKVVALEASDDEVEAWLTNNTIDLGVVMNPSPERNAVPLGHDEWVAVVPVRHPLALRSPDSSVNLGELVEEPFVLATGGCVVHGKSLAASAGLSLADLQVTVQDWASAFALVREGVGITLVPSLTLPESQKGLRVLPLRSPIYRHFGLVCSDVGKASHAVRAFLDVVRAAERPGR
ncbi:MAG: LysR family transcriptional regulator [Betaproteobacteria bacterium]|nr:LysR family transcriptional regulator [Betaproteobacteria bacterium]